MSYTFSVGIGTMMQEISGSSGTKKQQQRELKENNPLYPDHLTVNCSGSLYVIVNKYISKA